MSNRSPSYGTDLQAFVSLPWSVFPPVLLSFSLLLIVLRILQESYFYRWTFVRSLNLADVEKMTFHRAWVVRKIFQPLLNSFSLVLTEILFNVLWKCMCLIWRRLFSSEKIWCEIRLFLQEHDMTTLFSHWKAKTGSKKPHWEFLFCRYYMNHRKYS